MNTIMANMKKFTEMKLNKLEDFMEQCNLTTQELLNDIESNVKKAKANYQNVSKTIESWADRLLQTNLKRLEIAERLNKSLGETGIYIHSNTGSFDKIVERLENRMLG